MNIPKSDIIKSNRKLYTQTLKGEPFWQERLARIEAVRELQREQELQDCTFRPAINGTPPEPLDQPVIVPGLGRCKEQLLFSTCMRDGPDQRVSNVTSLSLS